MQVWRLDTMECTQTLSGHGHGVLALAFTYWQQGDAHDAHSSSLSVDEMSSGTERPGRVMWLVSASMDHTARVWNPRNGTCKVGG